MLMLKERMKKENRPESNIHVLLCFKFGILLLQLLPGRPVAGQRGLGAVTAAAALCASMRPTCVCAVSDAAPQSTDQYCSYPPAA